MAQWSLLESLEPRFAERVRTRFQAQRHHALATLRMDGSPRISGIEVRFEDGEVKLGMMPNSLKACDLRRDSRLAIHSASEDPPEEIAQHDRWPGDAKLAGRAFELPPDAPLRYAATARGDRGASPAAFRAGEERRVRLAPFEEPQVAADVLWHPGLRGFRCPRRAGGRRGGRPHDRRAARERGGPAGARWAGRLP